MIITNDLRNDPASNNSGYAWSAGDRPLEGYTIKRGLGIGGFGEVYFATTEAGKEVAIKRIVRNAQIEVRGTRHCLNLRHPNLVQLYDVRQVDENQAYIVMEYIAGNTLRDVIEANQSGITAAKAVDLFAQIASGVAYLHSQGIVHRDLKPANIFLEDDFVKIGDYGLSKFISASRKAGHTDSVGTFHYMAPEISRGNYGKEVDIYALGVILYEMLSGRVPFEGQSIQEIVVKHMTAAPDMAGFASPYREVIERALAKDPSIRYSDVSAMIADLGLAKSKVNTFAGGFDQPTYVPPPNDSNRSKPTAVPPPFTPPPSGIVYEEPLAATVAKTTSDVAKWWKELKSPAAKGAVLIGGAYVINQSAGFWGGLAYWAALVYPAYYCIRYYYVKGKNKAADKSKLSNDGHAASTANNLSPLTGTALHATAPHLGDQVRGASLGHETQPYHELNRANRQRNGTPPFLPFKQWQAAQRVALSKRSNGERIAEWSGSMFTSGIVCTILATIGTMIAMATTGLSLNTILPMMVWLTAVVWVGSSAILGLNKLWEGRPEDGWLYRVQQMGVGLAIGVFAWGLDHYLSLPWLESYRALVVHDSAATATEIAHRISEQHRVPKQFFDNGQPLLPAYLSFFALLFGGIRWWRLGDRVRKHRFSMTSVIFAVIIGFFFTHFLYFPIHYAIAIATAMAITLQISGYWSSYYKYKTTPNHSPQTLA
jgi:eukaryotic-like serine/threonine-protein kinase